MSCSLPNESGKSWCLENTSSTSRSSSFIHSCPEAGGKAFLASGKAWAKAWWQDSSFQRSQEPGIAGCQDEDGKLGRAGRPGFEGL